MQAADRLMSRYRIWLIGFIIGTATIAAAIPGRAGADGGSSPAWKQPLPGTIAFLGDDGGGVNTATVCDSDEHFEEWVNGGSPSGCVSFQHGLKVVIEGLVLDPPDDQIVANTIYPLVRIKIPSVDYTGYVQLFEGIHPIIPAGAIIYLGKGGGETVTLAKTQDADEGTGLDLGEHATAKVLRYDPSSDGFDLYVEVTDGKFAGSRGWVFTSDGLDGNGDPLSIFADSMITSP